MNPGSDARWVPRLPRLTAAYCESWQAGDLRDCADHRLVLLQRALIKSNCYSSLSAAIH